MTVRSAFFAYPDQPSELGTTIFDAINAHRQNTGADQILSWKEDQVAGKFIGQRITNEIETRDVLAADITRLNFNVLYEIGFGLGKGKRLLLLRHRAFADTQPSLAELGILDTLG